MQRRTAATMIVMVESGRLGNQIFQYVALRSARTKDSLWLLGFDQLRATFDGVDARIVAISSSPLRHLVSLDYDKVGRVLRHLPRTGLIAEADDATPEFDSHDRLLVSRPAWYQGPAYLHSGALAALSVKPTLISSARQYLHSIGVDGTDAAFVHVRAGDYRSWPSVEAPAILSPYWYSEQFARLQSGRPSLRPIVMGDDPQYTREVADVLPGAHVHTADYRSEFALMTMCSSGVLSASSFAYWAAYFASRSGAAGPFVGPRYWAGHSRGSWYPPQIEAPFITYA